MLRILSNHPPEEISQLIVVFWKPLKPVSTFENESVLFNPIFQEIFPFFVVLVSWISLVQNVHLRLVST